MDGENDSPAGASSTGDSSISPVDIVAQQSGPTFTVAPVAGFWRRFAAFLIDWLVLGVAGSLLGWSMSSFWFGIGPYGRFVGLPIALLYFGLMDSRVAGGQTVGKRFLSVAVRTTEGKRLGVGQSMLRSLIWQVPILLNGWALPVMSKPIVSGIAGIIVFGVGGGIVLTLIFNRQPRQGLHDMLTHTFVLHLRGRPIEALPKLARDRWILPGATLAFAVVLTVVASLVAWRFWTVPQQLLGLQRTLQRDNRFFSVGVNDQTFRVIGGNSTRTLAIQLWYKGVSSEAERTSIMLDAARTALTLDDVGRFDLIRIDVMSAYDLGIASSNINYYESQPISTWRERVGKAPTVRAAGNGSRHFPGSAMAVAVLRAKLPSGFSPLG